jgi:hypothetical protein
MYLDALGEEDLTSHDGVPAEAGGGRGLGGGRAVAGRPARRMKS